MTQTTLTTHSEDRANTFFRVFAVLLWLVNLNALLIAPASLSGSLVLFLSATVVALFRPFACIYLTLFLLPFSPDLGTQVTALFHRNLPLYYPPGVDLVLGCVTGTLIRPRRWWSDNVDPDRTATLATYGLIGAALLLAGSAGLALFRNFHSGAVLFSTNGFLFNVTELRTLAAFDTYFPLRRLFYLCTAIVCTYAVFSLLRRRRTSDSFLSNAAVSLCVANIGVSAFAFAQYVYGIGYFRDPRQGVNSFFRDLHSFAGFELLVLGLALILLVTATGWRKQLFAVNVVLAFASVLVSGSRATVVLTPVLVAIYPVFVFELTHLSARRVALYVVAFSGVFASFVYALVRVNYTMLATLVERLTTDLSFQTLNAISTFRLENYYAALKFFGDFPVTGLGLGMYYRVSSVPGYSPSPFLIESAGENAHNYFLQVLAETGIVGLVMLLLLFHVPGSRSKRPLRTSFILIALALSNIFAHSLLETEILLLAAIFLGIHLWESSALNMRVSDTVTRFVRQHRTSMLTVVLGTVGIVVLSMVTTAAKTPFSYGQQCYQRKTQFQDGWVGGEFATEVPGETSNVTVEFVHGRPAIEAHPFRVRLSLLDRSGIAIVTKSGSIVTHEVAIDRSGATTMFLDFADHANQTAAARLVLRSSSCYNPKTSGTNRDSRFLGVRISTLEFGASVLP